MIFKPSDNRVNSGLYYSYFNKKHEIDSFFNVPYESDPVFVNHLNHLSSNGYDREKLWELLVSQNSDYGNSESTVKSIELLKRNDCSVVFTGQQAGILGGPLFTIYKGLTAIALSKRLTERFKRPFLPCFWVHSEDHDFDEVRAVNFRDNSGAIRKLSYAPGEENSGSPVERIFIDESFEEIIFELYKSVSYSEFKDDIFGILKRCYKTGRNIADAFSCWIAELLGPLGLIIVNPSQAELKEMATPVLLKDLEYSKGQFQRVIEENKKNLEALGYNIQVQTGGNRLNTFYCREKRLKITIEDSLYNIGGEKLSFERMEKLIGKNPADFSPNVLLRPVVQDYLFPTAVYVAGPSELSYFAQLKGVYELFGVRMPCIYPRKSLTIIDGNLKKKMEKLGLTLEDILVSPADARNKVRKTILDKSLDNELDQLEKDLDSKLESIRNKAMAIDTNLAPFVRNFQSRIAGDMEKLRNRLVREYDRMNETKMNQTESIINELFPQNTLQERFYNIAPYLVKYSSCFIEELLRGIMEYPEAQHLTVEV